MQLFFFLFLTEMIFALICFLLRAESRRTRSTRNLSFEAVNLHSDAQYAVLVLLAVCFHSVFSKQCVAVLLIQFQLRFGEVQLQCTFCFWCIFWLSSSTENAQSANRISTESGQSNWESHVLDHSRKKSKQLDRDLLCDWIDRFCWGVSVHRGSCVHTSAH